MINDWGKDEKIRLSGDKLEFKTLFNEFKVFFDWE